MTRSSARLGLQALVAACVMTLGIAFAAQQVALNGTAEQLAETTETNKVLLDLITDCNTPGGECFQRLEAMGDQQTLTTNAHTVAVALCSIRDDANDSYNHLIRCITRVLEQAATELD